ncbi:MAG: hypothetical protein HMLKMBBP_00524 [Planctomycetes bacterium]|nr:hypothetical protein [Planctomycetota bacterium]
MAKFITADPASHRKPLTFTSPSFPTSAGGQRARSATNPSFPAVSPPHAIRLFLATSSTRTPIFRGAYSPAFHCARTAFAFSERSSFRCSSSDAFTNSQTACVVVPSFGQPRIRRSYAASRAIRRSSCCISGGAAAMIRSTRSGERFACFARSFSSASVTERTCASEMRSWKAWRNCRRVTSRRAFARSGQPARRASASETSRESDFPVSLAVRSRFSIISSRACDAHRCFAASIIVFRNCCSPPQRSTICCRVTFRSVNASTSR